MTTSTVPKNSATDLISVRSVESVAGFGIFSRTAAQLDRLAVRRLACCPVPFVLACRELIRKDEGLLGNEPLQRSQPIVVIVAAVVRLPARLRTRDFGGETRGPF